MSKMQTANVWLFGMLLVCYWYVVGMLLICYLAPKVLGVACCYRYDVSNATVDLQQVLEASVVISCGLHVYGSVVLHSTQVSMWHPVVTVFLQQD